MEDDIVALLALDAEARGLFPQGSLNKQGWTAILSQPDVLQSEHWLLAYEANQKNWLFSPAVAKDKDFRAISNSRIEFYNSTLNTPQFPLAGRAIPGGTMPVHYA